jgi:hypothetical protein
MQRRKNSPSPTNKDKTIKGKPFDSVLTHENQDNMINDKMIALKSFSILFQFAVGENKEIGQQRAAG